MIYLFNSAYRALYQENLLSTLFLPHGWVNEYRYRCSPQRRNVSETFSNDVEKLKGKHEAVITFINRFGKDRDNNDAYEYYPIRKAIFLSCREESEQLYIRVQLLDFIYPNDIHLFTKQFIEKLSPLNLPKLTNNNPEEVNDGYYAIYSDSVLNDKSKFMFGDSAWVNCVNAISKTKPLISSIGNQFVFAKAELREHAQKEKVIHPHISNNPWYMRLLRTVNDGDVFYKVTKNHRYDFHVNYVYPLQEQDSNATAKMEVEVSDNIVPLGNQVLPISSRASRITFPFTFKEPIQYIVGRIGFAFFSDTASSNVVAPKRSMSFQICYSKGYWLAVIVAILLFVISGILIGIDLSKVGLSNIGDYLKSDWTKIIAPVLQALVLFWLFKLTGKKLL